jgi:hypothetical protein
MGSLTLYFDRCFGRHFPSEVERMNPPFSIESHYKLGFNDQTSDDEWLAHAGKKGWIVLSHDGKFHKEGPALAAIILHKVGCFYLWGGQVPVWYKIGHLTTVFPKINKIAPKKPSGFFGRRTLTNLPHH